MEMKEVELRRRENIKNCNVKIWRKRLRWRNKDDEWGNWNKKRKESERERK